ncbi:hypothetical protein EOD39_16886 [Acipenser ruthenus]|uniref:Uncharacterized protein n=1 Tax=Acipenser ruthenus TaxID=7906 RepID=A0A444V4V4_ACIRT|nr:hypothetical protein EOD39_16886 [Acipenser ruthenus]
MGIPARQVVELDNLDARFIWCHSSKECVESQYKCAGRLRHNRSLASLQIHVEQGWRLGFSCRVFCWKLKDMWERASKMKARRGALMLWRLSSLGEAQKN